MEEEKKLARLNLGCGELDYREGFVNLDNNLLYKADVYWDLDKTPWSVFEDNTFDEILCNEILEHVDDIFPVLDEIYRISKPNAKIEIRVPHWSHYFAWSNFTHKRAFSYISFNPFQEPLETLNYPYNKSKFKIKIEKKYFTVYAGKKKLLKIVGGIFDWIINFNPLFTERFLCKIIPISHIFFILKILK